MRIDLSKLSIDELLLLLDQLCSTEELRALAAWAHVYNLWQMMQAGHRRVLYLPVAAHRRCLPDRKQVRNE